jgi:hypothetical protein
MTSAFLNRQFRYGLIPTCIFILLLGGVSMNSSAYDSTPLCLSAAINSSRASRIFGGASLSVETMTPINTPTNVVNTFGLSISQPALISTSAIRLAMYRDSGFFQYGMIWNVCGANGFSLSVMLETCLSDSLRAASRSSSEIIFNCCALLIASSKTNRDTMHNASMATPPITSQVATRWMAEEYFGDSSIIPPATAKLAATLTNIKIKWGQNGSAVPSKTALKYVGIAAILGWLFVAEEAENRPHKGEGLEAPLTPPA